MRLFDHVFKRPKPSDVFRMPDNPSGFTAQLSRRRFWRDIDRRLLDEIAGNAGGNMELLRDFVFVSEEFGLVANNFVALAKEGFFGCPLSAFALTLYRLGSDLCKSILSAHDAEQNGFQYMAADLAFTSAVLCDPLMLPAYAGMAFLYGGMPAAINKKVALEWCQKYKDAEKRLLSTPDRNLSCFHQAAKSQTENPEEARAAISEIALYAPHLLEGQRETESKPMRRLIEELEERLLSW